MKTNSFILLFILSAISFAYSQPESFTFHSTLERHSFETRDPFQLLIAANAESNLYKYKEYQTQLTDIVQKLKRKQAKRTARQTLEKVFYHVHRKQLDWYEEHVDFTDVFENGEYDCVTGTALYALILKELGYKYTIYEFDYHVLLVVDLGEERILIEATDPLEGFIPDEKEIARRLAAYSNGEDPVETSIEAVSSNTERVANHVNNKISLLELAALQYFNLSVRAFNENNIEKANELIRKAKYLYPSYRIKEVDRVFANQQKLISSN